MKKSTTFQLVLAAMFTALGVLLPMAMHPLGLAGSVILPMHIPVLLCGFILGSRYGTLVGLIVPFISSVLTGMPPIWPVAVSMALELAAYGFFAGFLSRRTNVILALIGSMLAGRVVMGLANLILLGISGNAYTMSAFLSGAFITALPGIIIQLILIPAIIFGLRRIKAFEGLL